jgi:putative hydrolase of the HAD superfamily
MNITTIGLDADDTLWHNETLFRLTHDRFVALLADHGDRDMIEARLAATERRNLRLYGYGVKGFTLSMIETAMELTGGEAPPSAVREILAAGREMLAHPVETLPGVDEALARLSERYRLVLVTKGDLLDQERKLAASGLGALSEKYRLVLITKGDLMDQERKVAASGLGDLFAAVEIVSEKDRLTYDRVFARHGTGADEAVMAGNSMKSDVLPALEAGAFAVHIPYAITWAHELADAPENHPRYGALESISDLPEWIAARG